MLKPFSPAILGPGDAVVTPASAECRTSDITLAEFKTLTGKMDALNPAAQTPQAFLGGTPNFRTDIYGAGYRASRDTTITTRVTAARRPPVPDRIAVTW